MRNHNNNNNNHNNHSEERFNGRDFLLKRLYSFGFEWNLASERMVMEPATTSPWRGFFLLLERFAGSGNGVGGGSSRRTKSMMSPMFMRLLVAIAGAVAFSSSWLRPGDLEALLSPDKFNRRAQLPKGNKKGVGGGLGEEKREKKKKREPNQY
ncbi:hypothetical protein SO802_001702 [Lithocarpus litseifolius]|uniref:Uncharacterized protein n=1 Tax=Lithocarpus litseifolius TaxID=425828 RepID=A0AAW2DYN8_9ROSI